MFDIKKIVEDWIAGLLVAGVVAFGTMTYQFAQMRVEIDHVRIDVNKLEATVTAMMARQSFYKGDEEAEEIRRIAAALEKSRRQPVVPGGIIAAAEAAQEK